MRVRLSRVDFAVCAAAHTRRYPALPPAHRRRASNAARTRNRRVTKGDTKGDEPGKGDEELKRK
jgi:hypothetical protein